MVYDINLPGLGMKEKNIKDLIVEILSIEWPLTLKKIHNILKKRYKTGVSYQAVHKVLQELVDKEILIKNNREYSLNIGWIKKLKGFSEKLEKSYIEKTSFLGNNLQEGKEIQSFVLDSMYNLDRFLMSQIEKFLTKKEFEKTPLYSHWQFGWWPLFISRQEYQVLKKIINPKRAYATFTDNSNVTKFCSNFYIKSGMKSKTNIKLENNFDFIVFNDMVIQIYYPRKLVEKILSVFDKVKNIEDLDIDKINEIFEAEYKIDAVILKNKNISKLLSDKVLSVF